MNESPVERIKKSSNSLRGTLAQSLLDEHTGQIREADQTLIKFHGMYMQDDRDKRAEREEKKLDRLYSYMIRLRLPGGFLSAGQWVALHEITAKYSSGVIKITTRQTVQLHGILKHHIKPTVQAFDKAKLDSIAACGDVNRNVAVSAHPAFSAMHEEIAEYATKISERLLPKTNAYYEIWLDAEKINPDDEKDELYQDRYLPRKFKIAIAIPPFNDVDVFTNDIGIIAIVQEQQLIGFNVAVGGGMGTTHGNAGTYPRLATMLGYVSKANLLDVVYAIATTQRDFGNRSDRKYSRLKYTIDKIGIPAFKQQVEERSGLKFGEAMPVHFTQRHDDYGWRQNHRGMYYYTPFIEMGRIYDDDVVQLKSACYAIAKTGKASFRFTANQNIIIGDISEADKPVIEDILNEYAVIAFTSTASATRKTALACVAFNTCPLALAEAQRYLPALITKIEQLLSKHGLQEENISIRMTGCPNGCARPFIAEIGFVGTAYGRYNIYLGSDAIGTRLNRLYRSDIEESSILSLLDELFYQYVDGKLANETFGDFITRKNIA